MIFISSVLFVFGMLLLLIQALRITFCLIKIAYYLAKLIVYLAVAAVLGSVWLVQWLVPGEPEPIDFYSGEEDDPTTIELSREHFRRLRG
jgi:hypothetical protein